MSDLITNTIFPEQPVRGTLWACREVTDSAATLEKLSRGGVTLHHIMSAVVQASLWVRGDFPLEEQTLVCSLIKKSVINP